MSEMAESGKNKNRRRMWYLAWGVAALVVIGAGISAWYVLAGRKIWTDDRSINRPDSQAQVRNVLWAEPQSLTTGLDAAGHEYEPCTSPDGQVLYFVQGLPGKGANIYFCRRGRDGWTEPQPLSEVNTDHDELGPRITPDGRFLMFYSDRPGGQGQYDIWAVEKISEGWSQPFNLGPQVNSKFNDYSPAMGPGMRRLYFATNRKAAARRQHEAWKATIRQSEIGDYDIFSAEVVGFGREIRRAASQPATRPGGEESLLPIRFANAVEVSDLNTSYHEGACCVSPGGDFLYFTSNRPGGRGGFDLYRCRIRAGAVGEVESLGPQVNTAANETDPQLAMGGFRLYFSSDRRIGGAKEDEPKYGLFTTESREVYAKRRTRNMPQFGWGWWALLGALAALVPLLFFLRAAGYRHLSLLQKCLVLSLLVHILLTVGLGLWKVSREFIEYVAQEAGMTTAVNLEIGREVEVKMQIRRQLTDLPVADQALTDIGRAKPQPNIDEPPPVQQLDTPSVKSVVDPTLRRRPERKVTAEVAEHIAPRTPGRMEAVRQVNLRTPGQVRAEESRPRTPQEKPAHTTRRRTIRESNAAPEEIRNAPEIKINPTETLSVARPVEARPADVEHLDNRPPEAARIQTKVRQDISADVNAPDIPVAPVVTAEALPDKTGLRSSPQQMRAADVTAPRISPEMVAVPEEDIKPNRKPLAVKAANVAATRPAVEKSRPAPHTAQMTQQANVSLQTSVARVADEEQQSTQTAAAVAEIAKITRNRDEKGPQQFVNAPSAADKQVGRAGEKVLKKSLAQGGKKSGLDESEVERPGAGIPQMARAVAGPVELKNPRSNVQTSDKLTGPAPVQPDKLTRRERSGEKEQLLGGKPDHIETDMMATSATDRQRTIITNADGEPGASASQIVQPVSLKLSPVGLAGSLKPGNLTSPPSLFQRSFEQRQRLIDKMGGSKESEAAVARALGYLSRTQNNDGSWTVFHGAAPDKNQKRRKRKHKHDVAVTSLASLCYLAANYTPQQPGAYDKVIEGGLEYLLKIQKGNGDLRGAGDMYDHGIATLALSEAAIMTGKEKYRSAARKGAKFIIKAQHKGTGGWRYSPGQPGDTSVFGWQVMALHSVQQMGLEIPDRTRRGVYRWLERVNGGRHKALAGYQNPSPKPAMTAEAAFAAILMDQVLNPDQEIELGEYLLRHPPGRGKDDFYYWYYASLALMQLNNHHWREWNQATRDYLIRKQQRKGNTKGSWHTKSQWGSRGGRIYTTAMATLTLEVYYRYLPMYNRGQMAGPVDEE